MHNASSRQLSDPDKQVRIVLYGRGQPACILPARLEAIFMRGASLLVDGPTVPAEGAQVQLALGYPDAHPHHRRRGDGRAPDRRGVALRLDPVPRVLPRGAAPHGAGSHQGPAVMGREDLAGMLDHSREAGTSR